jgi:thiol-disulfide isomerase/thioredoxin
VKKLFILILTLFTINASSAEYETNFTIESFNQAQNEGKIIVVHSWNKFCSTCSKQKPILIEAKKDFEDILFLNYEQVKDKNIAKYLNINYWTTIAIYKNNKQIISTIGLTEKNEIYNFIKKGT